jgi:hypothetical protein
MRRLNGLIQPAPAYVESVLGIEVVEKGLDVPNLSAV